MPLRYKIDILAALKAKGWSTFRLAKEKQLSPGTIQMIRDGKVLSAKGLAKLCELLQCQPGDIIEYKE